MFGAFARHPSRVVFLAGLAFVGVGVALSTIFEMTQRDFHLPGTQMGQVPLTSFQSPAMCSFCHGNIDEHTDPSGTWSGSLMALAGRDPLFFAQMTLANQDVTNAGYFCMRCHVPMSFVTGHAMPPDGSALDERDREGVSCHFCHSMVDPIYRAGVSPPEDEAILAALTERPQHYGNAMFVLDPQGRRRGPRSDAQPLHEFIRSPFFSSGPLCGTCHDVGNVAVTKQTDGTYRYNALDEATPTTDLSHQFPLERTFTEWRLSAFANGGVDMGGRFNGTGSSVVQSCQDCHMPKADARACIVGPRRPQMATHEFAGAAAQVLDLIAEYTRDDPTVDQAAIARARAASVSMLERAASLSTSQVGGRLLVRVTNESGHKIPTGHIEGRRIWINVQFKDAQGNLIREHGPYDDASATLDASRTTVYEMRVGLSPAAAAATGLPAGETTHMALADTITKDNRIPPRGFTNRAFAEGGAPPVGAVYADGQYWSEVEYRVPLAATQADVALYYQNTPREYIEHLREANHTDHWGETLHRVWTATGRGAPIRMAQRHASLTAFCPSDMDDGTGSGSPDGGVTIDDLLYFLDRYAEGSVAVDLDDGTWSGTPDGGVTIDDLLFFLTRYAEGC